MSVSAWNIYEGSIYILLLALFSYTLYQLVLANRSHQYHELKLFMFLVVIPSIIRPISNFVTIFFRYPDTHAIIVNNIFYAISAVIYLFSVLGIFYTLNYCLSSVTISGFANKLTNPLLFNLILVVTAINATNIVRNKQYSYNPELGRYTLASPEHATPFILGFFLILYMLVAAVFLLLKQKSKTPHPSRQTLLNLIIAGITFFILSLTLSVLEHLFGNSFLVLLELDVVISSLGVVLVGLAIAKDPQIIIAYMHWLKYVYIRDTATGDDILLDINSKEVSDFSHLPSLSLLTQHKFGLHSEALTLDNFIANNQSYLNYHIILISSRSHYNYMPVAKSILERIAEDQLDITNKEQMIPLIQKVLDLPA